MITKYNNKQLTNYNKENYMSEKKEEKKVSFYDCTADAYREVSISKAKKFIKSAKEVEKQIQDLEDTKK